MPECCANVVVVVGAAGDLPPAVLLLGEGMCDLPGFQFAQTDSVSRPLGELTERSLDGLLACHLASLASSFAASLCI